MSTKNEEAAFILAHFTELRDKVKYAAEVLTMQKAAVDEIKLTAWDEYASPSVVLDPDLFALIAQINDLWDEKMDEQYGCWRVFIMPFTKGFEDDKRTVLIDFQEFND